MAATENAAAASEAGDASISPVASGASGVPGSAATPSATETTDSATESSAETPGSVETSISAATPGAATESSAATPDVTTENIAETLDAATESGASVVYMTADISAEGLLAVYLALGASPAGEVAVKISTGEPPNSNYLRPELIKDLVQSVGGVIVECNTAYGGSRASNAMHYQVAKDHGFTEIAEFDLLDADGSVSLPVVGGEILTENFVGAHFDDYDYVIVLSHFKGHQMAGYGGAIKNASIGIASSSGKSWIHSGGTRTSGISGNQDQFLMSMAEANKSVADRLNGNVLYINVMNRLSVDCDCNGNPAEPDMHDIGILASFDPVALDQACVDLVAAAPDSRSLMERIDSRNGMLTIRHGAKIGLGSQDYTLVSIDD
jgi:uncharacterized Fe-S center protein